MGDDRSTDSTFTLAMILALVVVFAAGGLYLIYRSSKTVQSSYGTDVTAAPSGSSASNNQTAVPSDEPADTNIAFQEGPGSRMNAFNSDVEKGLRHLTGFFTPSKSHPESAPPTTSSLERGDSDPSDDGIEPAVMAWKNPPAQVGARRGDVLKISVPGEEIMVVVKDILKEADKTYWLVQVKPADVEAVRAILDNPPPELKVIVPH